MTNTEAALSVWKYRRACGGSAFTERAAYQLSCATEQPVGALLTSDVEAPEVVRAQVDAGSGGRNTYFQAIVALVVMKSDDEKFIDRGRDDCAISTLMGLSYYQTEKLIEHFLRGRMRGTYDYPSDEALSAVLQDLEDTGVFGPGT